MAVIDSLLVELGFEYNDKDLDKFKTGLDSTKKLLKKVALGAVGAATAITGMITVSTAATDSQGKFADKIGESIETLDALQFALIRSGGSSDEMAASLQSLSARAAEASRGIGSGVEVFSILGITANDANGNIKKTSDLLIEVSDRLSGLARGEQIELAEKLGLSGAIPLLQQGPAEIRNLIAEARALGVATKEDASIAAEFQDSLADVLKVGKNFARLLTRELAPRAKELNKMFLEWWKNNRKLIEQKIPVWIDKITLAVKLLSAALGVFFAFKILGMLTSLVTLLRSATIASGLLNASVLLLPGLIAAGITLLIALMEDAKVFFEGGESVIGDLIAKFPKLKSQIETVAAALAALWDIGEMAVKGWLELFSVISSTNMDSFIGVIKDIPGVLKEVFKDIRQGFNSLIDYLVGRFPDLKQPFDDIASGFSLVYSIIGKIISGWSQLISLIANTSSEEFEKALADIPGIFKEIFNDVLNTISESFPTIGRGIEVITDVFKTAKDMTDMIVKGWMLIFGMFENISFENIKNVFKDMPGFIGESLKNVGGNVLDFFTGKDETSNTQAMGGVSNTSSSTTNSTRVDKVEISVQGGADSAEVIAESIYNIFQQTTQDLNTVVDQ